MPLRHCLLGLLLLAFGLGGCQYAGSLKTAAELTIEARSTVDMVQDNVLLVQVNAMMAGMGAMRASTEVYEQRVLVTGLFSNRDRYLSYWRRLQTLAGLERLHWHAVYLVPEEEKHLKTQLLSWPEAVLLDNTVGVNLIRTVGIADLNLRVATDAFGTVYLMGRVRSDAELNRALWVASHTGGVREVISYVDVRP